MSNKPITGTVAITLKPITIAPPAPPCTYLGVAEGLMPSVAVLASSPEPTALALALLSAHILECLLKAYLSKMGVPEPKLMEQDIRHNLSGLWDFAVSKGLAVQSGVPVWVQQLSDLHDSPYYLRYSKGAHLLVLPAAEPMATELRAVLAVVRAQVV